MAGMGFIDGRAHQTEPGLRLRMRGEERRIASQHDELDDFCRTVHRTLIARGARAAINDFLLFESAMDAHMTIEEDIYFPALHGLRPDSAPALTRLVAEHEALRMALDVAKQALKRDEKVEALRAFEALIARVNEHELREENLLAWINEGPVRAGGQTTF